MDIPCTNWGALTTLLLHGLTLSHRRLRRWTKATIRFAGPNTLIVIVWSGIGHGRDRARALVIRITHWLAITTGVIECIGHWRRVSGGSLRWQLGVEVPGECAAGGYGVPSGMGGTC